MHVSWFKNEEHLVYINGETELPALEKALKFPGSDGGGRAAARPPDGRGADRQGAQAHERSPARAGSRL